jgi:hypothetical protein
METHAVYRRQRIACYSDIVAGTVLFLMFIAIQLALYGMLPVPEAIVSAFPQAPIMATLAPISQGDILILTTLTAYGAIWGVRLIGDAIEKLRDLSELESDSPAVT